VKYMNYATNVQLKMNIHRSNKVAGIWNFFNLTFTASILMLFYKSIFVFYAALTVGTAIGLYCLIKVIRTTSYIRFGNLLATILLLSYAGGGLVTSLGYYFLLRVSLVPTSFKFGSYTQEHISWSLAFVFIASAFLFIVSMVERPIFSNFSIECFSDRRVYRLIWVGFVLILIALLSGEIGYMGIQVNEESRRIGVIGSLAHSIVPILLPTTIFAFIQEKSVRKRITLSILFILFFSITVILGRRVLWVSIVLVMLAVIIGSKKALNLPLRSYIIGFFGISFLSIFSYFGSQYFLAMRLYLWSVGNKSSLLEQIHGAFQFIQNSSIILNQFFRENMIERPFILPYLATLLASLDHHTPLLGLELKYSLLASIPSVLFPQKMATLPSSTEDLVHSALGLPISDGPNTILTAGLDDFGLIGMILYPLLLITLYYSFLRLLRGRLPIPIYYMVAFSLVYNILYVEQSLAGILIVPLRNLVILIVLCLLVWKLPSVRIRARNGSALNRILQ
jgi:hypothetical protein